LSLRFTLTTTMASKLVTLLEIIASRGKIARVGLRKIVGIIFLVLSLPELIYLLLHLFPALYRLRPRPTLGLTWPGGDEHS
jgi:hypothetical protein